MVFLVLLSIPLVIAVAGFVTSHKISWREFLIQVAAQIVIAGVCSAVIFYRDTDDVEILNGRVTSKSSHHVSCGHSYRCNPHTCTRDCGTSKKPRKCNDTCWDTCYRHSYDVDWTVSISQGERITIHRVDDQGIQQPPRWTEARVGEPASVTHHYANYIKASPGTLFRRKGFAAKYAGKLPNYPDDIYDYYRLDRFVQAGTNYPLANAWNAELERLNSRVGPERQANLILVVTPYPQDFFLALEEHWVGGKKNDVILVIGIDSAYAIQWAQVMAWSTNKVVEVKLRDAVLDTGSFGLLDSPARIITAFEGAVLSYYKRKPMHDFEYLAASVVPTTGEWVVALVLGLAIALGLITLFHKEEVFS
jgi:hypothetical protein